MTFLRAMAEFLILVVHANDRIPLCRARSLRDQRHSATKRGRGSFQGNVTLLRRGAPSLAPQRLRRAAAALLFPAGGVGKAGALSLEAPAQTGETGGRV